MPFAKFRIFTRRSVRIGFNERVERALFRLPSDLRLILHLRWRQRVAEIRL